MATDVMNALGWSFVCGLFLLTASLCVASALFFCWRSCQAPRVGEEMKTGQPLSFHSPDDTPRFLVQYPYRQSLIGSIILYLWVFFFSAGYLLMMVLCWFVYPSSASNGLGAPDVVIKAFGGWNGLVGPWLFLYTIVHILWIVIIELWDAMQTFFMIPALSMQEATHVLIEEAVSCLMDDDLEDPDALEVLACSELVCKRLGDFKGRFKKLSCQTILPIREDVDGTKSFEYTCVRYTYCRQNMKFTPQGVSDPSVEEMLAAYNSGGLSLREVEEAMSRSGCNAIHVHVPSVIEALVAEFMEVTKVFASLGTWAYMVYSSANLGMLWFCMTSGSGAFKALWITRPNHMENARLAQLQSSCTVLRMGAWTTISAADIVLGDVVRVDDSHCKVPCDGVLIKGSIVANESMLTGEPMPVEKVAFGTACGATMSKRNRAFAGTTCLQSAGPCEGKAVMIATAVGALTTRGQLVRMVLFPSSVRFRYNDQMPIIYAAMLVYMLVLVFVYIVYVDMGSWVLTYLLVFNTCTMCLNPMLPVSLVLGQSASSRRLQTVLDIGCLQPCRIPIAGKISTMVFDKTGTITKDGMDFAAVVDITNGTFGVTIDFNYSNPGCETNQKLMDSNMPELLSRVLASCHTVTKLRDGSLIGNPVEVSMVRTCGWDLSPPLVRSPSGDAVLEVVRQLEFDHSWMTSGVVVRCHETSTLEVFVKGSYERIRQISNPESVPNVYDATTARYAREGFYTLAVATKTLREDLSPVDLAAMTREFLESNLNLCGLLLFINDVKPDSEVAIRELRRGAVHSIICTGDNALTGLSIGRKCGIVNSFGSLLGDMEGGRLVWRDPDTGQAMSTEENDLLLGVTQSAWRYLYKHPDELDEIWDRIVVFGRMKPDDKVSVIKYLQSHKLVVGMTGDGGNDCGALRAAHVGMALSDAEASMVSPFSSARDGKSLLTVVDLIREGRACLSTNLATFQFFMVYAFTLTIIRTFLTAYATLSMGEFVWLTNDIVFGIIMVTAMVRSKPSMKLASYRPTATLIGWRTVSSIAFPVLSAVILMFVAYSVLWSKPWYVRVDPLHDLHLPGEKWMLRGDNYDSSIGALFLFVVLSNTAFVNTYGGAFRECIFFNTSIVLVYVVVLVGICWLTLSPPTQFSCLFRLNCDTTHSLASGQLWLFAWFSRLGGAGLVGGCFVGPQVMYWQADLESFGYVESNGTLWFPEPFNQCKLPVGYDPTPGYKEGNFGCVGPNNCYSGPFKIELCFILLVYIFVNHLFAKVVLQGPVAAVLREKKGRAAQVIGRLDAYSNL